MQNMLSLGSKPGLSMLRESQTHGQSTLKDALRTSVSRFNEMNTSNVEFHQDVVELETNIVVDNKNLTLDDQVSDEEVERDA